MFSKKALPYLFLILSTIVASSCVSNKRTLILNDRDFVEGHPVNFPNDKKLYRIQTNDVLNVRVQSADEEVTQAFNINNTNFGNFGNPASLYVSGYSVDREGYINLPIIGKVMVIGLSMEEATNEIQKQVDEYLKNATVIMHIVSFRITVVGEVNIPGNFYVYNAQASLFDALGMAGDITPFGNREELRIIRQTDNGSEVINVNIKDSDFLSSEYYYLLPNDVLYVQPQKSRARRTNLDIWPLVLSGISTIVLLISFIQNS